MVVLIPSRSNSLNPRTYDPAIYRERNQIERLFNRLKNCRRVASRYEKPPATIWRCFKSPE